MTFNEGIENVTNWAAHKGLLNSDNANKQLLKVMEEVGETAAAMIRGNKDAVMDGIGDSFVTLIILSKQLGYEPDECLQKAWEEIKDRTGTMVDGSFVKDSDIVNKFQIKIH